MKRLTSLAILSVLAACQSAPHIPLIGDVFAPKSADEALETYYRTLPDEFYPRAPQGVALPDEGKAMTRILVASCLDEEKGDSATMRSIAGETADLFLMIGTMSMATATGRPMSTTRRNWTSCARVSATLRRGMISRPCAKSSR